MGVLFGPGCWQGLGPMTVCGGVCRIPLCQAGILRVRRAGLFLFEAHGASDQVCHLQLLEAV